VANLELLLTIAVLVIVAVAAGTLTARLFMAASRAELPPQGPNKD